VRTTDALRQFGRVLEHLAGITPPKVVLYFGDTLRSRPGQFYYDMLFDPVGALDIGANDPYAAASAFDNLTAQAGTVGARIYTGEPRGLMREGGQIEFKGGGRYADSRPVLFRQRDRRRANDAQRSLASLAEQTGGRHFKGHDRFPRPLRQAG
jgi:hypothetical protein